MIETLLASLAGAILALPVTAVLILAVLLWFFDDVPEAVIWTVVATAFGGATLAGLTTAGGMVLHDVDEVRVPLGTWFSVGHYEFEVALILDRLSVPFAIFGTGLVGLVGAFSQRYLHREARFARFFLLLSVLGAGVVLVVLAGSLDLIFMGWELVGLSSALLVAFFDHRPAPVRHGLRAFITYRLCDAGLLSAVVWLHHTAGTSAFVDGSGEWPSIDITHVPVVTAGLFILLATLGKSAQVPLGGWLPRAMEGPTTSSAIFYGALSIHLGPYLLLRNATLLEASPWVAGAVFTIGLLTALHGTVVGRVQSDIKSALAYASMTQVGVIFMEIALGLRFLALAHVVGHASYRSLQILRSPSLLHDQHNMERAVGSALPHPGGHLERLVPRALQPWLYRLALERGYLDAVLVHFVVAPMARLARLFDRLEHAWSSAFAGPPEDPRAQAVETSQDIEAPS